VPGISIPYVMGNPILSLEEEKKLRKKMVKTALKALSTNIDKGTIFSIE
jgi:glycine reductase